MCLHIFMLLSQFTLRMMKKFSPYFIDLIGTKLNLIRNIQVVLFDLMVKGVNKEIQEKDDFLIQVLTILQILLSILPFSQIPFKYHFIYLDNIIYTKTNSRKIMRALVSFYLMLLFALVLGQVPGSEKWELTMRSHELQEKFVQDINYQGMDNQEVRGWKKTYTHISQTLPYLLIYESYLRNSTKCRIRTLPRYINIILIYWYT